MESYLVFYLLDYLNIFRFSCVYVISYAGRAMIQSYFFHQTHSQYHTAEKFFSEGSYDIKSPVSHFLRDQLYGPDSHKVKLIMEMEKFQQFQQEKLKEFGVKTEQDAVTFMKEETYLENIGPTNRGEGIDVL